MNFSKVARCYLVILSVTFSVSCGGSMQVAADVANAGAAAGEAAAPVLEKLCVEPMQRAAEAGDRARALSIAKVCDPAINAYDLLRSVHVALRAAVVSMASGHIPLDTPRLIADVVQASGELALAVSRLK